MARTYVGNVSVSSLVNAGLSAQKTQAAFSDKIQAYNWEYGPQDEEAYNTYKTYLQGRQQALTKLGGTSNLMQAQTFQKTNMATDTQFRSAQVRRANIAIQEGNYTESQKADLLKQLATQAYSNNDFTNGDSLTSQYNSLNIKMQNEAMAASSAASAAATKLQTASASAVSAQATALKQIQDMTNYEFQHQVKVDMATGAESKSPMSLSKYAERMNQIYFGGPSADGAHVSGLLDTYHAAMSNPNITDDAKAKFQDDYQKLNSSGEAQLFSPQMLAYANTGYGQPWTVDKSGKVVANAVVGQRIEKDQNGQAVQVPVFSARPMDQQTYDSSFKDKLTGKGGLGYTTTKTGTGIQTAQLNAPDTINSDGSVTRQLNSGNGVLQPQSFGLQVDPNNPEAIIRQQTMPNGTIRQIRVFPDGSEATYNVDPKTGLPDSQNLPQKMDPGFNPADTSGQVGDAKGFFSPTGLGGNLINNTKNNIGGDAAAISSFAKRNASGVYTGAADAAHKFAQTSILGVPMNFAQDVNNWLSKQATVQNNNQKQLEIQKQQQYALQAQQAAQAAIQKQQQNAAAAAAAASAQQHYLANLPSANQLYSNDASISPAQKFAAVQSQYPAGQQQSEGAIAAGIGASAGYNPNALLKGF